MKWILSGLAFGAAGTVFLWQYASGSIPGLAADTISPLAVTQSSIDPASHIKIVIAPPIDRSYAGESAPLRLLIENDGNVSGQFSPAEVASGGCIRLDTAHAQSDHSITAHEGGAVSVQAGAHDAVALKIPVDTICAGKHLPRSEPAQLSYTWSVTPAAAAKPVQTGKLRVTSPHAFTGLISISPITVTSRSSEFIRRLASIALLLIKDFTWPVLILLMGFWTQSELARRSARLQIFSTLLPSYTKLVQVHYLPIARGMQIVANQAAEIDLAQGTTAHQDALLRTFCAILLIRRRLLLLFRANGGIFFRSAIGEKLFGDSLSFFYRAFQLATGNRSRCEACAASLKLEYSLQESMDFLLSPERAPVTKQLLKGFTAWATDPAGKRSVEFNQYLNLLMLSQKVLTFECDRIYYQVSRKGSSGGSSWYLDPPELDLKGKMSTLPPMEEKEILPLFTEYLNGIPKECRKGVDYPK